MGLLHGCRGPKGWAFPLFPGTPAESWMRRVAAGPELAPIRMGCLHCMRQMNPLWQNAALSARVWIQKN